MTPKQRETIISIMFSIITVSSFFLAGYNVGSYCTEKRLRCIDIYVDAQSLRNSFDERSAALNRYRMECQ